MLPDLRDPEKPAAESSWFAVDPRFGSARYLDQRDIGQREGRHYWHR
jgi:hypothetical protein